MMRLALIIGGIVAALYWFNHRSSQSGPSHSTQWSKWSKWLRWLVIAMIALLLLLLTVRGGASLTLPLLALVIPLLLRWKSLWRPIPTHSGGSTDTESSSTVDTRFLRMSLDHRTGEMQGTVIAGRFKGHELHDLDLQSLSVLWRECQVDPQSAAVLEAYLDRTQSDDWRDQFNAQDERAEQTSDFHDEAVMDLKLAYEILGLQPGASRDEIKVAHRRLMQRVHPDHGGSTYLAARINQAKDYLLDRSEQK